MNRAVGPALVFATILGGLALPGLAGAQSAPASFSLGPGNAQSATIYDCPGQIERPSPTGSVRSLDGQTWLLPGRQDFAKGRKAGDLYNSCTGITPSKLADVTLPEIVVIDPDGEVITGYLMADNYFELYVNGRLVGVDPITFTPFNSSIIRFKAKRPYTLAVRLIDWEENLGLGSESGGDGLYHPGDGGFVARFSDGTVTDETWKAQVFYIAPLTRATDLVQRGAVRDTSTLGRTYPEAASQASCGSQCYAAHFPVPGHWTFPDFADSEWPNAATFTRAQMGIDRNPAYANFPEAFGPAKVIWSSSLVFDNVVLARKTVR